MEKNASFRRRFLGALKLALVIMMAMGGLAETALANDPRVKPLLQEALRLYSERQYVRALDLFKQVQQIEPENPTAEEYIKSSEQRILEWETQGGEYGASRRPAANWDTLLNQRPGVGVEGLSNAKDIIAARRSLVDRMKNRSMNTENIVKIEDSKGGVDITLFHDQLFLPGLQTLRDEALPILANVADLVRTSGERDVRLTSVAHSDSNDPFLLYPARTANVGSDPALPQLAAGDSSFLFNDIEATRAFILFTYIAQKSMGNRDTAHGR